MNETNNATNVKTPVIAGTRRQNASRANGAKSRGPVTAEGKARSSRNAVTHGCLAALLTLSAEDADLFNSIQQEYIARFEPRDQVEHDLVEEIVRAKFQLRQAWIFETALLRLQIGKDAEQVDSDWRPLAQHDRRALAWAASVEENRAIPLLQRYSRSLSAQAERTIKLLLQLREQRLPPTRNAGERNEPVPISEHPASHPAPAESEPAPAAFAPLLPAASRPHAIFAYAVLRPEAIELATLKVHQPVPAEPKLTMAAGG